MGMGNCFGEGAQIEQQPLDDINAYINQIKEKRKAELKDKKQQLNTNYSQHDFDYFSSTYENSQTAYASTCRSLKDTIDTLYMSGNSKFNEIIIENEDQDQQFCFTAKDKFRKSKVSLQLHHSTCTRRFGRIQRSKSNEYTTTI